MRRPLALLLFLSLIALCPSASLRAKDEKKDKEKSSKKSKSTEKPSPDANAMTYASQFHWADWIEPNFPFFSSVLDARDAGEGFPKDNLTPRGLILNLGHNLWACFDTDLLRIACIWQGEEGQPPITMNGLAPGSYHIAGQKTKDGQEDIPKPVGKVWLANGIYPGWQVLKSPHDKPIFTDPREPGPDKDEVGRGPLNEKLGRFIDLRVTKDGAVLEYEIAGVKITQTLGVAEFGTGSWKLTTTFVVGATDKNLAWMCSDFGEDWDVRMAKLSKADREKHEKERGITDLAGIAIKHVQLQGHWDEHQFLTVSAHAKDLRFQLIHIRLGLAKGSCVTALAEAQPTVETAGALSALWPQTLTTRATLSQNDDAYVVDDIPLPLDNPWKRNVRLADLDFFDDQGNAAAVTMDGDVWLVSGLKGDLKEVKWKRFASGLHEPMSIVAKTENPRWNELTKQIQQCEAELTAIDKSLPHYIDPPTSGGDVRQNIIQNEITKLKKSGAPASKIAAAEKELEEVTRAMEEINRAEKAAHPHLQEDTKKFQNLAARLDGLKAERTRVFSSSKEPHFSLYIFDKNGIWKLRDSNNDGECDVYEMFCNQFSQTAETREFPNAMKLAPDGSFVISKGGQEGTRLGKHNGSVLRISPDGKKVDVIGYGLRQPYVGVHPKTGMITAGDQEGNYVPTTPLHIIRDHKFYGHLAEIQPHEQYPETITEPLTWVPHSVIASALTQCWLSDAKMGPINDQLIFVSYNKPELFRVLMNNRQPTPQATVVPWIKNLDFPTLNAHVNPADGQLYAIGFQIWGTTVKRISGLARIRYTGKPRVLLQECVPCDKGVLLKFNLPLDKSAATNPDNFNVERWNYKRTFNYGSGHFKSDGSPGQEWMVPSSAYVSKDGTTVFVGLPDMKTNYMQMRVGYGLKGAEGLPAQNNAYFTAYDLTKFDPAKEGFDALTVDLTPRKLVAAAQAKPTLEEGKRLYEMMGCVACHSVDGTVYGKVGPSWKGLYGTERILAKGGDKAVADEIYLKESIQNPPAKVVKGYEKLDAGMPIYAGVLNDSQIDSLILFIKSLK